MRGCLCVCDGAWFVACKCKFARAEQGEGGRPTRTSSKGSLSNSSFSATKHCSNISCNDKHARTRRRDHTRGQQAHPHRPCMQRGRTELKSIVREKHTQHRASTQQRAPGSRTRSCNDEYRWPGSSLVGEDPRECGDTMAACPTGSPMAMSFPPRREQQAGVASLSSERGKRERKALEYLTS